MSGSNRYDPEIDGERRGWHIGKRVDVGTIVAVFIMMVTGIWWVADLQERVSLLETKQEAIQKQYAAGDEVLENRLNRTDEALARELRRIDGRFDRLETMLLSIAEAVGAKQPSAHSGMPDELFEVRATDQGPDPPRQDP